MTEATRSPRAVLGEVLLLWVGTLLIVRLVQTAYTAGAPSIILLVSPVLFMYAPVFWLQRKGEDPDQYPLAVPAYTDTGAYLEGLKLSLIAALLIVVPFTLGYHYWQTWGLPTAMEAVGFPRHRVLSFEYQGTWPDSVLLLFLSQLLFTAIPEEMFYRAYMQSRLDEAWAPRWRVFGADVGPGLIVASLIFAIGHSIVVLQWWHPFIFFPSLIFGWLRARTGTIVAGALFHAWCNAYVTTLDTLYGIVGA